MCKYSLSSWRIFYNLWLHYLTKKKRFLFFLYIYILYLCDKTVIVFTASAKEKPSVLVCSVPSYEQQVIQIKMSPSS